MRETKPQLKQKEIYKNKFNDIYALGFSSIYKP